MYNMPFGEAIKRKQELIAQNKSIGVPTISELQSSENVVYVHEYTRDDGTVVKAHWRSKGVNDNRELDTNKPLSATDKNGTPTGGAARVDSNEYDKFLNRGLEQYFSLPYGTIDILKSEWDNNVKSIDREIERKNINNLPKNNDIFFEKERMKNASWLMRINSSKNKERPDAKLLMDIALVGPKRVPSTQDYQFISSKNNAEINAKYNLSGNKKIPGHYDGFIFSETSPTAKALNSSKELKEQIFADKNFDKKHGMFKRDKLEIEFNTDKNMQYSFGHMTILNPKIENGYITGIGFDKYDYEAMYSKRFENVSQKTKSLNNKARFLQAIGKLKNYYILAPVKIKV